MADRRGSPATVVFDLDGTLVDSAPDLAAATNHVLQLAGRAQVSLDQVRTLVGQGARQLIAGGFAATGEPVGPDELERLYPCFIDYYSDHISDAGGPFPGVVDLLDTCRASGLAMAVCTNKLEGLSLRLLDSLGLSAYFGAVVGPDTLGVAKPAPEPYVEAVRRAGGEVARSIMIGDTATDIATARAASVAVIAVSFGYTSEPVHDLDPDHVVDHFSEIWPLLEMRLGSAAPAS